MSFCENTEGLVLTYNFYIRSHWSWAPAIYLTDDMCFGADLKDCNLVQGDKKKKSLLIWVMLVVLPFVPLVLLGSTYLKIEFLNTKN